MSLDRDLSTAATDVVVIVDADALAPVDRYVAMMRATQRLVLLER